MGSCTSIYHPWCHDHSIRLSQTSSCCRQQLRGRIDSEAGFRRSALVSTYISDSWVCSATGHCISRAHHSQRRHTWLHRIVPLCDLFWGLVARLVFVYLTMFSGRDQSRTDHWSSALSCANNHQRSTSHPWKLLREHQISAMAFLQPGQSLTIDSCGCCRSRYRLVAHRRRYRRIDKCYHLQRYIRDRCAG